MTALLLGGQLLALLSIVAVSVWGRKNLHDESRTRARLGTTGVDWTMSTHTSLLYTPAIGAFVLVGTLALVDSHSADEVAALGLAVLVMLLLAHWSSVRRAAR